MRVDPGGFEPTEGSFLIWKHLFRTGIGQGQRCLDVGCGCGILAIQLALNGARHVGAIDIQREAVANAMANAFRNGVDGRVHR
jgi:ribosomal protein L11 methylase PrmA